MPPFFSRLGPMGAAVVAISLNASCSAPDEGRSDPAPAGPRNVTAKVGQPPGSSPSPGSQDEVFVCGGTTTRLVVDRWFEDLETALAPSGTDHQFNNLVRGEFSIRDAQGTVRRYNLASVEAVTRRIIGREEWREISIKGPDQIRDAGWRGCFLDDGKVWFEASEGNGFRLTSISREMPWGGGTGD